MWCVCRANFMVCKKTVSLDGPYLKVNIKSTKKAEWLLFRTATDRMSTFVMIISHGFTFVIWAAICLTSEIWPFMRWFFCSLYLLTVFAHCMNEFNYAVISWLPHALHMFRTCIQWLPTDNPSQSVALWQIHECDEYCIFLLFFHCVSEYLWYSLVLLQVLQWSLTLSDLLVMVPTYTLEANQPLWQAESQEFQDIFDRHMAAVRRGCCGVWQCDSCWACGWVSSLDMLANIVSI